MAGFDNGTLQGGVFFQAKQFGSILRGFGAPVPQAGVVGDVYVNVENFQLFTKRSVNEMDPWGHFLFTIPAQYRATLKWFSAYAPGDDVGQTGDYCLLWAGYLNYGTQPSIFGPKQASGWPENGNGPDTTIAVLGAGTVSQVGLSDEGPALADSPSRQLVVVGVLDEYILAVPVLADAGDTVTQQGLQSGPAHITVQLNPTYAAQDQHTV